MTKVLVKNFVIIIAAILVSNNMIFSQFRVCKLKDGIESIRVCRFKIGETKKDTLDYIKQKGIEKLLFISISSKDTFLCYSNGSDGFLQNNFEDFYISEKSIKVLDGNMIKFHMTKEFVINKNYEEVSELAKSRGVNLKKNI